MYAGGVGCLMFQVYLCFVAFQEAIAIYRELCEKQELEKSNKKESRSFIHIKVLINPYHVGRDYST